MPDGADQFIRNGYLEALAEALFPVYNDPKLAWAPSESQLTEMV
jgi:hypothetical protein